MSLVPTRVLIINRQLDFAVTVKRSLEQLGGFEVTPFTTGDTALEYLRSRPHDLVLVDFTLRGTPGVDLVLRIREIQPDIAIIASPKNAETHSALRDLELQDVIDTPLPVRQLMPLLLKAVQRARETLLPDTAEASPTRDADTLNILPPEISTLDRVSTGEVEIGSETIDVDMSDVEANATDSDVVREVISTFDQLALEEPPVPEHATVGDLRESLLDTGERIVVELLSSNQVLDRSQPLPPDDGENPDEPALARKILENALDYTSPLKPLLAELAPESPSVEMAEDLDRTGAQPPIIDEELAGTPAALPESPVAPVEAELAAADHEESRLAQMAVDLTQASLESTAEATLLSRNGEVIAFAGQLAPEDIDDLQETLAGEWAAGQTQARIRFINLPGSGKDYMLYSRLTGDDLVLTMVFAGNMPLRVIRRQSEKLLAALNAVGEPPATANPAPEVTLLPEAELRPAAPMPPPLPPNLPEITRPATQRLQPVAAPTPAPTPALEPEPAAALVPVTTTAPAVPCTLMWLLRDPNAALPEPVKQVIIAGLDQELNQRGWTINTLRVHEDYVYLYLQLPGDRLAADIVRELRGYAARLAVTKLPDTSPENLWADAYYALTPGRELDTEAIQTFIRFGRLSGD